VTTLKEIPHRSDARFDLEDLGLLDCGTDREAQIVVRHVGLALHVQCVGFFVADESRGVLLLRAKHSLSDACKVSGPLPLAGSLAADIIENDRILEITSITDDEDFAQSVEVRSLSVMAYLGVPVHGPAGETLGVLGAISRTPRPWSPIDRTELREAAHLLSRHVLLKAALRTVKLLSRERDVFRDVRQFRN
jgi:GAF domain-containing protein